MELGWLAHLDAHIANGQVATEAESAETLSWLLQLEPEQRWCLLLSRDPCLRRLVETDYRRLLNLMVSLESAALLRAPLPPQPCIDASIEQRPPWQRKKGIFPQLIIQPPAEQAPEESSLPEPAAGSTTTEANYLAATQPHLIGFTLPAPHRGPLIIAWILVLLTLAGAGVGLWLFSRYTENHILTLTQETQALRTNIELKLKKIADFDQRFTQEVKKGERQRQTTLAFLALAALSRKLKTGQPFSAELITLKATWHDPAQLAILDPMAERGLAEPNVLLNELIHLNEALNARQHELIEHTRIDHPSFTNPYARLQTYLERKQVEALLQTAITTLAVARQGDWQAARDTLWGVEDPDYRAWRERVARWLEKYEQIANLLNRIWSQWANEIAAPNPAHPP